MKVYPLGVGGFIPNSQRETACILVVDEPSAVLFDVGTGVRRLTDPNVRQALAHVDELKVVLSHFHLDHCCGIPWLLRLWRKPLELYVPSQSRY